MRKSSPNGGDDEEAGDTRGFERGQVAFFDAAANDDGDGTLYSERAEFFEGAQVARTVSEQAGIGLRGGRMEGARAEVVNDGKIAGMDILQKLRTRRRKADDGIWA